MWQRIKNIYHLGQAVAANYYYGFPAREAAIIGVTGTDGKTTTTSLIYHILKSAGEKVSMITSVGAYIGNEVYDIGFHVTTPSPFGLQQYLRRAVDAGNRYIVLETTSHALDQNRVWGIPYKVGVLTNVTHEHLDYHGSWETYAKTKFRLLERSETVVINRDDQSYELYSSGTRPHAITYSLHDGQAEYTPKKFPFRTNLLGDFNTSNCLAAIAACEALGVKPSDIKKALATFEAPPGRQEVIYDKEFRVMIDFAHTPNAFAQLLPDVKEITNGRLIHVFGSAGKRDPTKRPEMGTQSSKYADIIVLTAEDPRNEESIEQINAGIIAGIGKKFVQADSGLMDGHNITKKLYFEIPDRKEAIHFAIGIAKKGDTVLLTGKSHEKSMNYGHGEEPWDEFATARKALEKKRTNQP
jgi:UDP-N-acetylmuramoyl-L-alanyl-D-glutamate--2,6-diaminopimelate ligase